MRISVNEKIYLKDPESSELGKSIVKNSIELIDDIGFEAFTFKKLGSKMGSPESTIYRYFENKHRILLYLISWYWCWLEYRLVFATNNIVSNEEKLRLAIDLLTSSVQEDQSILHINEVLLHNIVITESFKAYHIKEVDVENKEGFYMPYKRLVQRVSEMILAINKEFKFPHMLISTVIEGDHHQRFFARHLPALTDMKVGSENTSDLYTEMVMATIRPSKS